MKKNVSLIKQMLNYSVGEIWAKIISLIGLPIIAGLLSVDEYGKAETAYTIISIMVIVIVLGTDAALKRYYYEKDSNYASYIKFALRSYFIGCSIIIIFLILFNIFITTQENFNFEFGVTLLNITVITCLFMGLKTIYTSDQLVKRKTINISIIKIIDSTTMLILSIVFLKYINNSAEMRIFAQLIVAVPLFIFFLVNLKRTAKTADPKLDYKMLIKYTAICGLPIMLNQISGFVLGFIDRFMIIGFFGYTETGLYSFAYKIGMVIAVLTAVVSKPMYPELLQSLNENKVDRVKKLIRNFSGYGIEATALLILLYKEITLVVVPQSYQSTTHIVYIIFLSYLFQYLYVFYTQIEAYYKKAKIVAIVSTSGAVLNIILNLILMNFFGYEVAAVTTLISFALIYLSHYIYCKKKFSIAVNGISIRSILFLSLAFVPLIIELLGISNTTVLISKGIILVIMIINSTAIKRMFAVLKRAK